jgi:hypothetical protein
VTVLDEIVNALLPARISGEAAELAKCLEAVDSASEDLVRIRLVPDVPDEVILGAVEGTVEGNCQLHHPEVRRQVATGLGEAIDQECPNIVGQLGELVVIEVSESAGEVERFEMVE